MGMGNAIGQFAQAGSSGQASANNQTLALAQYFINKRQQEKDERNRPQYKIPEEITQGLALANQRGQQGLPEAQKQEYLSNLQRGQAYSIGQAGSRKAGLQGIGTLNENQNTGYANLLSQDSAARMANQKEIYGQLQNVANYKDQAFQLNQVNPYYENIAKRDANRGALFQNTKQASDLSAASVSQAGQAVGSMYSV